MNSNNYPKPDTSYPPTSSDIDNMQHYISTLETSLHEGDDVASMLIEYSHELDALGRELEHDMYLSQASKVRDLTDLVVGSVVDFKS
jgi:hypothetical protein